MAELSEYEKLREHNIVRNAGVMAELGLTEGGNPIKAKPKPKAKARKARDWSAPAPAAARASKRKRGETPDYTRETLDNFGEELDRVAGGCSKQRAFGGGLANPTQAEQAEGNSFGGAVVRPPTTHPPPSHIPAKR